MSFVAVSIVSTLIVLGIMVLVHEFGHFAVAKLCGVRVEVFSIGFGKRLFGIRRGDTDYRVSLLPLGGYVKMAGELGGDGTIPVTSASKREPAEDEAPAAAEPHRSAKDRGDLNGKPRWQRIAIALAGPFSNFILALLLMTGLFMMHNEVEVFGSQPANIDFVKQDTPASRAGLTAGDRITRFDSVVNPTWEQVSTRSALSMGQTVPLTVERNGQVVDSSLRIQARGNPDDFSLQDLGMVPVMQPTPVTVHSVEPSMPAAQAGLKAGDKILSVNGHSFHSVQAILGFLQQSKGAPLDVTVDHNGTTEKLQLKPVVADLGDGSKGYRMGFSPDPPPFRVEQLSFPRALHRSIQFNLKYSGLIVEMLHRMVTRHMTMQNLSGPIGIARETGIAATQPGWQPIIGLMAVISLNLGIFNLLPIPILDGGVILLLLIEGVMRRDLNQQFKERIYQTAFVFLLIFAAFVIFNDITKLSLFSKIKP
jgi:regulator of sigma E protease